MKRKILLMILGILLGFPQWGFAQAHPITLSHHLASQGTSLATEVADISTFTLTNIFSAKPVWIIGSPAVILDTLATNPVTITGTPSVNVAGTPTVSITGTPTVSVTGTPSVLILNPAGAAAFRGFTTELTVTVGTSAAVVMPTLPAGTQRVLVTSTVNVNVGDSGVTTGSGKNLVPLNAPGFLYTVSTTTPAIYFRALTATGVVTVLPIVEP